MLIVPLRYLLLVFAILAAWAFNAVVIKGGVNEMFTLFLTTLRSYTDTVYPDQTQTTAAATQTGAECWPDAFFAVVPGYDLYRCRERSHDCALRYAVRHIGSRAVSE